MCTLIDRILRLNTVDKLKFFIELRLSIFHCIVLKTLCQECKWRHFSKCNNSFWFNLLSNNVLTFHHKPPAWIVIISSNSVKRPKFYKFLLFLFNIFHYVTVSKNIIRSVNLSKHFVSWNLWLSKISDRFVYIAISLLSSSTIRVC